MPVTRLATVVVLLGTLACRTERDDADDATDTSMTSTDTGFAQATPQFADTALAQAKAGDSGDSDAREATPDGKAIGAFIAASQHEIQHGRLAMERGSTQIVRDIGRSISRDHDDFVARAREKGKSLGILTATEPTDTTFHGHGGVMGELRDQSGAAFDRTFLQHEVDYHRWLIDAVNTTMLPKASNSEVKTFLQQAIPTFEAHMKAAQELLAKT
jgi:putative membrane protein